MSFHSNNSKKDPLDDVIGADVLAGHSISDTSTVVIHGNHDNKDNNDKSSPRRPAFVKCGSMGPFVMPSSTTDTPTTGHTTNNDTNNNDSNEPLLTTTPPCAEQVNQSLNLNLGQTWISPENKILLWILKFLNSILIEWWERLAFWGWNQVPLAWRRNLSHVAWKLYFPLHRRFLGTRTGIHPHASLEYHALSTVLWWGRLFPVTVPRMRFSLSQLNVFDDPVDPHRLTVIHEPVTDLDPLRIPPQQQDFLTVKGLWLQGQQHTNNSKNTNTNTDGWTLMWVYGGAFLAGDVAGNTGKADWVSQRCHDMDVFVCEYRLAPEYCIDDMYWDICLAYRWLCQRRNPHKIVLLGISSGGALCTRLMQYIGEHGRGEALLPSYMDVVVSGLTVPAGAVLLGPFCDFTTPKGSLLHYVEHDLIVNRPVLECGLPYLDTHCPQGQRQSYSPVHRSMEGLPPLCVVTSAHEAVFDMTVALINKARHQGVPVTVGCWKYMCHVFSFFNAWIPEGRQSMEFTVAWIRHVMQQQPAQPQTKRQEETLRLAQDHDGKQSNETTNGEPCECCAGTE